MPAWADRPRFPSKRAEDVPMENDILDKLAKRIAVADLRETYNAGWNEYDEAQEDGSSKLVSNPKLSEAEFEAKLSLCAASRRAGD